MAERLTPGVYVTEISSGIRPIQGVGTSTAAFIGEAARGIPDLATFLTSYADYERHFGGHRRGEAGLLAQAVQAFFDAGGRRAYAVRVLPASAVTGISESQDARETDVWGLTRQVISFEARGKGVWSSHLRIHIEAATNFVTEAFKVRVEWSENGSTRTVETFDNVRMDQDHEDYAVDLINETSKYIRAIDLFETEFLDVEERDLPPIPETVARLSSSELTIGGMYTLSRDAELLFGWKDNASGTETDRDDPPSVLFSDDAVNAATAKNFDANDEVEVTPGELAVILRAALSTDEFRVLPSGTPVIDVTSDDGPFDLTAAESFNIDGGAAIPVTAIATTAASLTWTAASVVGVIAAGQTLTLNHDSPQSYVVGGGDAVATLAELIILINTNFVGIQALDVGGDLVVRTDALGDGVTLSSDGDFPAPSATVPGAGNAADIAAVTAGEFAEMFNATPEFNGIFLASVDGVAVRLQQVDLLNARQLQGGATLFGGAIDETGGPWVPDASTSMVTVEPAVASRAYLIVEVPATNTELDGNTLTLTAASGGFTESFVTAALGADETAGNLASELEAVVASTTFDIDIDAAGNYLVIRADALPDGVTLSFDAVLPIGWQSTADGEAGMVVDAQSGVEITVSERLQVGVGRVLSEIGFNSRGLGLVENSTANPDLRPEETDDSPVRLIGGSDGAKTDLVTVTQIKGEVLASGRSGLHAFDTVDVHVLSIPGKNDASHLAAGMSYCDLNDVFFIADGPGGVDRKFEASASEVKAFVDGLPTRSKNAAMFYPWIEVPDPVGVGRNPKRFVPPSGHLAGIFARTDNSRGVWKAPAGVEAVVSGAIDLQHQLVDAEQDLLNPIGLNCVRQFPGAGIVSWGSRTLASDPEWRYVPVRRTALFLKDSLRRGMQWAVFEPNDSELWDRIRLNINAFMLSLFRQGAFQGASPEEAFLVRCDRETNPQELVDQGIVTAMVAFAPLKPAEFVVINISQKTLVG